MSGTKLNAIALYANFVVIALLGLLINPLLVHSLGAAQFGIWKSMLRLMDLSGVADGRATQALKWIVAHASKSETTNYLRRAVGASIVIWVLWLPVLLLAVTLVILLLPTLINDLGDNQLSVARWTGVILAANIVIGALLGIPDAVLFGTNQGYRSVAITTAYVVFSNVGMLLIARAGYGLPSLAAVMLCSTVLGATTVWLFARKRVAWWGIARPDRTDINRFAGFSNWTLAWSLVQMLLISSELLLIGFLTNPTTVTKFTFSSYLVQFALSICLMTGSAITPKLGALVGSNAAQPAARLVEQTREVLLAIMTVSGASIILLNKCFVSTWIGPEYYMGSTLNILMVIAFLQLALIRYDAQIQDVGLKITKKVLVGLASVGASLVLSVLFYSIAGSLEALYAGLILGRIPASFAFPKLVKELMPASFFNWRILVASTTILAASIIIVPLIPAHGWIQLGLSSLSAGIILAGLTFTFVLSPSTRATLLNGCPLRLRRESPQ